MLIWNESSCSHESPRRCLSVDTIAQHAPSASRDTVHHSTDISETNLDASHVLWPVKTTKQTNVLEHMNLHVCAPCAEWQSEHRSHSNAKPMTGSGRCIAGLIQSHATKTKWMCLFLHSAFWCYQVTPAFNDISIAAKGWDGLECEDDNMMCYGTEGVDSRPNTSPYWCTKCCDTRHQQDGLSLPPLPRHPTFVSITRTRKCLVSAALLNRLAQATEQTHLN